MADNEPQETPSGATFESPFASPMAGDKPSETTAEQPVEAVQVVLFFHFK